MKNIYFLLGVCALLGSGNTQGTLDQYLTMLDYLSQILSTYVLNDCTTMKLVQGLMYEQQLLFAPSFLANTTLSLITREDKFNFYLASAGRDLLNSPHFNRSLPVVVYAHGFILGSVLSGVVPVATTLARTQRWNVLMLDPAGAIISDYMRSSTYVHFLGDSLGAMLAVLRAGGISERNMYLVGHGMGAHLCGFTGKAFTRLTGRVLDRITALDPAGPCFYQEPPYKRLTSTDASFVDVIHTDTGIFGYIQPLGTVDFYPNGGHHQPFLMEKVPLTSHMRAWQIFIETICSPKNFRGQKCVDYETFSAGNCKNEERAFMGYEATRTASGNYYMLTAPVLTYGLGEAGIMNTWPLNVFKEGITWTFNLARALSIICLV